MINKSTVPVGSTRVVERALGRDDVSVVSNPEFLREGSAVHDCLHPDRIVIGGDDQAAAIRVAALFEDLQAPLIVTDPASAETIKYAANAFLATKISFVNAVANLCEAVGADVREVVLGMGYDKRIGFEFLKPGPGWGGSCFPKDTRALVRIAEDAGYDFGLLKGVIAVNDEQFERVTGKVERLAGGSVDGAVVGVWGLTFKARTDDLRDSPSLEVIRRLWPAGRQVRAYDPTVTASLVPIAGVEVCADPYAACEGAAVLVVLTEWDEFRWLDFDKVAGALVAPSIVDARNLLDPAPLRRRASPTRGSAAHEGAVVVTGGAGFLGSHLCRALLERGDEVVAIDNLLTGRLDNITHLFGRDGFTFVEHDVSNFVHVPGPGRRRHALRQPGLARRLRAHPHPDPQGGQPGHPQPARPGQGQGRPLLPGVHQRGLRRPLVHPQPETYWGNVNPIGPRGVYDEAKRFAEAITMAYHRYHGVDVRIVRIFNTYGRACGPTTGGSSPTSSCRPWPASRSRSTATAARPAASATSTTRCAGFLALLDSDHVGPGQHRQPRRVHRPRAGRARPRGHRVVVGDRLRAAARRRPDPAPARHHPGPRGARLGARGPRCGRASPALPTTSRRSRARS